MSYKLSELIDYINCDAINKINDRIGKGNHVRIRGYRYSLTDDNIQSYLKLILILDELARDNIIDIECVGSSSCVMSSQLARQFVVTIKQLTNININIDKLLCRFTNCVTIHNIIDNINDTINYDNIYYELVYSCSYNIELISYVISNNLCNYKDFVYKCYDINEFHVLDILLSNGINIMDKLHGDSENIQHILKYISLLNLKYFSGVAMSSDQYVEIFATLQYDKLEEFLYHYDTTNIVYSEKNDTYDPHSDDKRARLLMNRNGLGLEIFIKCSFPVIRSSSDQ
jgi:hypothetical protein